MNKKLFRSVNMAVLLAATLAVGAVAGLAQDPCTDAAGMTDLDGKVRAAWADKTLAGRKNFVNTGKQFLEKYGACESQKEFVDWLKVKVHDTETKTIPEMENAAAESALVTRFDNGMKSKNWDEVYAAGKEILAKYPGKYMPAEIVLGSIGYDEAFKDNNKYNDETLKYARQSLADLESGKSFVLGKDTRYGLSLKDNTGKFVYNFEYSNKDDAIGWMNAIIGYMLQIHQKNLKDAQPYLYKATQANSTSSKDPKPYELIGWYYWDELAKLSKEIKAIADSQVDTDTPEVRQQKIDQIEGKVALANGYAERAADAFARAYNLGAAKAYKDLMYARVQDAWKARHGDLNGLSPAWIAAVSSKPLPNPTTPVAPISDPKPAATTTGSTEPAASPAKPPVTTPVSNPATPPKPNGTPAKPNGGTPAKPSSKVIKKAVAKRSV